MSTMETDEVSVLTVREVARRLRIGRDTAYALCRRPGFPALRLGGVIRVPVAALEQWLREQSAPVNCEVGRNVE